MRVLCSPAAPPRAAAAAARRLPLRAPPRRAVPPRRAAFASLPPPADDRRRGPSPPRVAGAAEPSSAPSPGPAGGIIAVEKAINAALVNQVIRFVDTFWADKPYARFYALETVARVPYFAYLSVLHLYETLGWWRRSDYLKVHFAESWNELHHLLIMEALGGNERWVDRALSQHTAVGLYWITCLIYVVSPRMAYNLMELVEEHAFETYDKFLQTDGEELKKQPPPEVALRYYNAADPYMFDEFAIGVPPGQRRPRIETLYDVFVAIRDDEGLHAHTMRLCQTAGAVRSPHDAAGVELAPACEGVMDCVTSAPTGMPQKKPAKPQE